MATKIIKLTNGSNTYLPITTADAVQYRTSGTPISVQDAIEQVAGAVLPIADDVTTNGNDINSIAISYSTTNGIVLSNNKNGGSNIKLQGENGVTLSYSSNVLKIQGHSDVQHIEGRVSNNVAYFDVKSNGGTVGLKNAKVNTPGYANITFSYTANQDISIAVAYTDTNTHVGSHRIEASYTANKATYINLGGDYVGGTVGIKGDGIVSVSYTDKGDIKIYAPNTNIDEKITAYARSASSKYYILGATGTANQKPVYDSNVYLDQAAGKFYAQYAYTTTPNQADNSTRIPTTAWVNERIGNLTGALNYKGTIGTSGGTVTALPASHEVGDVYIVSTSGITVGDEERQVGDMIVCKTKGTAANDSDWTVIPIEFTVSPEESTANIKANGDSGSTDIATIDGHTISLSYAHGTVPLTRTRPTGVSGYGKSFSYSYIVSTSNGHITEIKDVSVTMPSAQKLSVADLTASTTAPAYIALSDGGSAGIKGSTPTSTGYASVYVSYETARKNIEITVTYTDTHLSSKNIVTNSSGTANTTTALTNGNVYLKHVESNSTTPTSSHRIAGSGEVIAYTDTSGNITIYSAYDFAKVSVSNTTTYGAPSTGTTQLVADVDADELTIKAENDWIKVSTTASSDTVQIAHKVLNVARANNLYRVNIDAAGHSYGPVAQGKETIALPTGVDISGLGFVEGKTVTDLDSDWLTGALGVGYNTSYSPSGTLSTTATTHQYWYYQ